MRSGSHKYSVILSTRMQPIVRTASARINGFESSQSCSKGIWNSIQHTQCSNASLKLWAKDEARNVKYYCKTNRMARSRTSLWCIYKITIIMNITKKLKKNGKMFFFSGVFSSFRNGIWFLLWLEKKERWIYSRFWKRLASEQAVNIQHT